MVNIDTNLLYNLCIVFFMLVIFIVGMRFIAGWLFHIDKVIEILKEIRDELKKQ